MADYQSEPAGGVRLCFKSRGMYQKPVFYVRLTSRIGGLYEKPVYVRLTSRVVRYISKACVCKFNIKSRGIYQKPVYVSNVRVCIKSRICVKIWLIFIYWGMYQVKILKSSGTCNCKVRVYIVY